MVDQLRVCGVGCNGAFNSLGGLLLMCQVRVEDNESRDLLLLIESEFGVIL